MSNNHFKQWLQKIRESTFYFERSLAKLEQYEIDLNRTDPNNYLESLDKLIAEQRGPEYDELSKQVYSLFEEMFRVYLLSSIEQRKKIEEIFQDKKYLLNFLVSYPSFVSKFIKSSEDTGWIRMGLVAALIEGGRTDYRDLWVSLGTLYIKAKSCGINPESYFISVESLEGTNNDSFVSINISKSVLSEFLNSEYLKSITTRD